MSDHSPTGTAPAGSGERGPLTGNWPDQIADRIVSVVGMVSDRTTAPVTMVARAVVYGLLAGVLTIAAVVLIIIAATRLHVYLPFHPTGRQVWVVYAILGAIFTLAGLFCWAKRRPRVERK